jgi:hypothetical protein
MEGTPLLDVMRGLILEPEAQADFAADPSGYMQRFGYDDVPEDDLREAVGLVADTLPPDVAHAVNTAAASDPAEDDAYGDGTVGLLGRISTVEVTESVVPELDELPDAPADDDGFDDGFADEHDATTFGDVTRDFDEDAGEGAAEGAADDDAATEADDLGELDDAGDAALDEGEIAADAAGEAADDAGALADAAGGDVSFGDGGFDDTPAPDSFGAGEPEGFGQGSTAEVDDPALTDEGAFDGGLDDVDDDASFAPEPPPEPEAEIEPEADAEPGAFDDATYDDSFDEGAGDFDDGDVGQF